MTRIFRRTLLIAGAALAAAIVAAASLMVGAALVASESPGFTRLGQRVMNAYRRVVGGRSQQLAAWPARFETTLLTLSVDKVVRVPQPARGRGGGLTSFGSELVLLTNDGAIYLEKDGIVSETRIQGPDNHYAAYASTARSLAAQGYVFDLTWLRFHDILAVSTNASNYLIVSFVEWVDSRRCYRNAVARLAVPAGATSLAGLSATASDWKVIARTEPCLPIKQRFRALEGHAAGGRMTQLDEKHIALASGDFHWDGVYAPQHPDPASRVPLAQDPGAEYGKVLVIQIESGAKKILSSGNRNTQGIATDANHALWTVEHGPRGGDELNRQQEGANYGWPLVTLGTQYSGLPWPGAVPYGRHDGFTAPAYSWVPSVAVSGLAAIRGFSEAWDGDLIASTLKGLSLFRIRVTDGRAVYSERIPIGRRIREVHQHTNGQLVIWTDTFELAFLSAGGTNLAYDYATRLIDESPHDEDRKAVLRTRFDACLECHALEYGSNERAPSLLGIWGRPVASGGFGDYSRGLRARGGVWDAVSLQAFLASPGEFAPGTSMPSQRLDDPAVVAEIVRIIEAIHTSAE